MARKKGPVGNTGGKNKTLFSWDHNAKLWFPCLSTKRPRPKFSGEKKRPDGNTGGKKQNSFFPGTKKPSFGFRV